MNASDIKPFKGKNVKIRFGSMFFYGTVIKVTADGFLLDDPVYHLLDCKYVDVKSIELHDGR